MSKNVPTNSSLYSRVKSEAKKKFDRWPSAYGSAWLVKEYKRRGGGYRKAEQGMEVSDEMFSGYMPADMNEYQLGGGIPERYKNMGFSRVGQRKESTRDGKKWMVLAKKGDQYKVVHGGYTGMKDFSQHGSEKRKDRFWDRMGGKNSAKAKDPFSPLYWHKRLGTWAEGGEWFNEDSQDFFEAGGQSLYDYVKSKGYDPSFASRKKLLAKYVDGQYTGTAEQNLSLLAKLKSGEIKLDAPGSAAVNNKQSSTSKSTPKVASKPTAKAVSEPEVNSKTKPASKPSGSGYTGVGLPPSIMDEEDLRQLPQTGVIVDRGTNQAFVFGDYENSSFPVLTGRSTDPRVVNSMAGLEERRIDPSTAVTPTGYFLMNNPVSARAAAPYQGNVMGINGIDAYGVPAINTHHNGSITAIHQTYDPETREPLYDQDAEARRASAGCVNCRREDYERMQRMLPANDTLMVIDSRRPEDQSLLSQATQRYQTSPFLSRPVDLRQQYRNDTDATFVQPRFMPRYKKGGNWIQEAVSGMKENKTIGAFTEQARREGYENTQEFADYVLDNPRQFTNTTMKRAQFAKNMGKLNKAMFGMELNKYQVQGQTTEGINPFGYPGSGMGSMYLQELKDQELLANPNAFTNSSFPTPQQNTPTPVRPRAISSTSGMGNIYMQDQMFEEMLPEQAMMPQEDLLNLPSKGLAPIPVEMPKLGPMPTISLPQEQSADPQQLPRLKQRGSWGYEAMGSKDDPWWQRNVAAVAYAPGIAANYINEAIDNRTAAKGRKNYMTDYTDDVVKQGLALSRGDYEMNTDALDVVHRTPVQFGNYFKDGGETTIDETLLKDLIAAGADIEILE